MLTLEDQAFEDHELVFADMEGALFVTPPRGERRETVLDGLRFATGTETTAAGGRRVVVIDRSRTPSPEMLRAIGGALECSLDVAESLLFAPLARSPDAIRFARGYLEWLAEIWNGDERRRDLRIRALYLARAAGCFPRERAFPRECSGVLGEDRSAILDAATRLQGLWSHIVMWFRERRLRDLEAEASPDARATVRMIEDFTSGMRTMGDRLADVLGRIGERQVENLATRAASLRELEGRRRVRPRRGSRGGRGDRKRSRRSRGLVARLRPPPSDGRSAGAGRAGERQRAAAGWGRSDRGGATLSLQGEAGLDGRVGVGAPRQARWTSIRPSRRKAAGRTRRPR